MDIGSVITYLNKEFGYDINSDYYNHIALWSDWWRGHHKPFHTYHEKNGDKTIERDLYTLRMAKKVCEDWASLLLNEKTKIIANGDANSLFLQGANETGGIFGQTDFWLGENALVEKAFYSGTGVSVLRFDDMVLQGERVVPSKDTRLSIDFLPASGVIPLTVRHGHIVDVALVSEVIYLGKPFDYVETHVLGANGYEITNTYFSEENGTLSPAELPPGIAERICTFSDVPLFSPVSPNLVKNLSGGDGLGMAVFANAIDELKGCDLAFNNFCRDFKLGGKKVFYDQSLLRYDGKGRAITPDDIAMQLFMQMGDGNSIDSNGKNPITEYNPLLRVVENRDGVQSMLDYLSFKVGFGAKHYQFNAGSIVTATQYSGDKQELVQHASKHYIAVERHLQQLVRAILWAGKNIMGQPVDPDTDVTVVFDDGFIIDKEAERERDRQDVRDGLMQKWEFRVKWYGEEEADAKAAVGDGAQDDDPFAMRGNYGG